MRRNPLQMQAAAALLARSWPLRAIAEELDVSTRTLRRWNQEPAFQANVARLRQVVGEEVEAALAAGRVPYQARSAQRRVYFAQGAESGLIKIGVSCAPTVDIRVHEYSAREPLELLRSQPGDHRLKQRLCRQFAQFRSHGDWFHPASELLAYIDGIPEQEFSANFGQLRA